jgi:hypothetical protein
MKNVEADQIKENDLLSGNEDVGQAEDEDDRKVELQVASKSLKRKAMQKKTQDIKKRPKAKFSTTESSDELNSNSESSSGENVSDTVSESSPQLAEKVEIPFSDFKALAKKNLCIAGSWGISAAIKLIFFLTER